MTTPTKIIVPKIDFLVLINKKIGTINNIQISIAERYHSGTIKALSKSPDQTIIICTKKILGIPGRKISLNDFESKQAIIIVTTIIDKICTFKSAVTLFFIK